MIALWIILGIIVLILFWGIAAYNGFVVLKRRIENAWAQIDVQLKRRYDLIPNLVNSVKGYMKYEQETLSKVMEARAKAVSAQAIPDKIQAEGALTQALRGLLAVVENYPDLKASQEVTTLMEELRNTENLISFSRQFYNDSVMTFNTRLSVFPANIIGNMFAFKHATFWEIAAPEEREAPKVDLTKL
jgi:LemA protein